MDSKTKVYKNMLESFIKQGEKKMADFAKKVVEDPAHTLSWSHREFEIAAQLVVNREVLACVNDNLERPFQEIVELIHKYALERVIHSAKFPARSSSVTSDLMSQEMGAAWANILEIK